MNDKPTQEELRAMTKREVEQAKKAIAEEAKEEAERVKKEKEKRYCTYAQFRDAIKNYDPEKDFKPSLLCGCACPDGSISIIAARPGGGKTSAMINIVRETLLSEKEKNKGRKILYVNLEMNYRQILTNLHLSCIYAFTEEEEERAKLSQLKRASSAFYRTLKGQDWADERWVMDEDELPQQVGGKLRQTFMNGCLKAENLIEKAMDSGKLKIYDGIGQTNEGVQKEIEECGSGSLILLDYMQRLPAPYGHHNDQRYLQIQHTSKNLLRTAIDRQLVIIAGAQLKREDKTNEASMESIRESGDIEQDAHNVVVLAEGFAKVVKAREGGMGKKLAINPVKQFVFWETNGRYNSPQKDDGEMEKKTVEKKKVNPWDRLIQKNSSLKDT